MEGARRPGEMISSRVWSKLGISSLSLKIKGVGLGYKSGEVGGDRMGFCQEPKHVGWIVDRMGRDWPDFKPQGQSRHP